jgi:hypothetical protein
VCAADAEHDAGRVSWPAVHWLDQLARLDLAQAGLATPPTLVRREARAILYGFTEFHLERRMRSFALLARQPDPAVVVLPDAVPAPSP